MVVRSSLLSRLTDSLNNSLPFLGFLVSRVINEPQTIVYRLPMHTDRLLDEPSYIPTSHKGTTINTSRFVSEPCEFNNLLKLNCPNKEDRVFIACPKN